MKVIVNFPKESDGLNELEDRVAEFHAILVVEKIKQLSITDDDKEKMLRLVLDNLKNKSTTNV